MWDKEGTGGELLVLPGEPELVATVPRQGVEVGEEGGLLHVLPQEGVEGGKGGPVPVVDVSCRAHFKTVHCAFVVRDICEKGCVLLRFLSVALVDVHCQGDGELKDVELFVCFIHNYNVRFEACRAQV